MKLEANQIQVAVSGISSHSVSCALLGAVVGRH